MKKINKEQTYTLRIKEQTFKRISKYGKFQMTADQLVNRVLDLLENKKQ